MMGLGNIVKMATGKASGMEMFETLRAMGIDLSITPIEGGAAARSAFSSLAGSAAQAGARLVSLQGKMKNGEKVSALLILQS